MHWTMWENVITNEYGTNDLCQCQVSIPTIECDGATPTRLIYRKYKHHITGEYIEQWNMLECRKRQSKCFTEFIFWYWMRRLVIYPASQNLQIWTPGRSPVSIAFSIWNCFTMFHVLREFATLPTTFLGRASPKSVFFFGGGPILIQHFWYILYGGGTEMPMNSRTKQISNGTLPLLQDEIFWEHSDDIPSQNLKPWRTMWQVAPAIYPPLIPWDVLFPSFSMTWMVWGASILGNNWITT